MKNALVLAACAVLFTAVPAFAHGAHEHGVARLNVAVDGSTVDIDLESPLANPLSFEHAPSTPEQRQAVQDMAVNLRRAENIFVFPAAAQCRLKSVTLESEALPADLLQAAATPQTQTAAATGAQPAAATATTGAAAPSPTQASPAGKPQTGAQAAGTAAAGLSAAEVQSIVNASLDAKLGPIRKELAEMRVARPGFTEIFGGIGWLVGLAGVALYFKGRRG